MNITEQSVEADTIATELYYALLESSLPTQDFYAEILRLVKTTPYFFAPHVELLNYFESLKLLDKREEFLTYSFERVKEFLQDKSLVANAERVWTKKDATYIEEVLEMYKKLKGSSLQQTALSLATKSLQSIVADDEVQEYKNLVNEGVVSNIAELQAEVERNNGHWLDDTSRQKRVLVHQRTNAIALRVLSIPTTSHEYITIDGPNESKHTKLADSFPLTLKAIENFAQEHGLGLGRVALVRLEPHAMVYRHYDGEPSLQGRDRYHLVIRTKKGSLMTSGVEQRIFHEGEFFFFDNKKMHTAENDSDEWRVHVIFDARPSVA